MDYGRGIEGLIQKAKTIENREERNLAAQTIVEMMSRVVPRSRENAGWKRRMWDHMMVLSDWELDVDWPVWAGKKPETRPEEEMKMCPRRLQYKNHRVKYRHYGRIVETLVERAKTMEEGAERDELVHQLIEAMKKGYSSWNNATITPDVLFNQLYEMSDGVLDYRNGYVRVRQEEPKENMQENNEVNE
ncbi:MAG: DUF4290 domain-containing protein [Bacteroidales bacterium]|nr:DUF4290 domain-containing protein [Bacteroidales bacterium]